MSWPFVWVSYKNPTGKVDPVVRDVLSSMKENTNSNNTTITAPKSKAKHTENEYLDVLGILGPIFTIALYMLAIAMIVKYAFVIFGSTEVTASIIDLYVCIGIVVGIFVADCIFTHPNKEK